ncbi:Ribosome biogenesis protein BOP1 [Lonchura striata]|uniref:Ribosome biogenesis protein BOP1 n=1 Tax=Lonchura striata TaxID=40157 RepID=A0A218UBF5_9PASE|nr:Ribosome biogenesis protein BOP1 [Lonchura striata domestica]
MRGYPGKARISQEHADIPGMRTVQDGQTGAEVPLSEEQLELIRRLQRGNFGDVGFDPYEPAVDFFSHEVRIHPVTNRPADKRSFIPSLVEKEKVSKLVHAIKMGWIQPRKPKENVPTFYDLWAREDPNSVLGRHKMHVPAPKIPLPGHAESYNPPPEFLLSPEEQLAWEQQDPAERRPSFIPRKFRSLRAVPAYSRFIHERFERCLDLYLCPRQRRMRIYRGHSSLVRTLSVSPSGQWLVSGDNVICGSYDSKLAWFDLDLSTRPYRLLRHHGRAVRAVAFHRRFPLFASGSDDGSVIVCHGMVLRGHAARLQLGVLDVAFHPQQPWLFSAGADGTLRLYA